MLAQRTRSFSRIVRNERSRSASIYSPTIVLVRIAYLEDRWGTFINERFNSNERGEKRESVVIERIRISSNNPMTVNGYSFLIRERTHGSSYNRGTSYPVTWFRGTIIRSELRKTRVAEGILFRFPRHSRGRVVSLSAERFSRCFIASRVDTLRHNKATRTRLENDSNKSSEAILRPRNILRKTKWRDVRVLHLRDSGQRTG